MMTLISGGAGSGKSAFAERCVLRSASERRIYLATMQVWGEEDRQRVKRHRQMREHKGFLTLEQPCNLEKVILPPDSVVLLEDLSNLTANECFGAAGFDGAGERILAAIASLRAQAAELIIVTNELFSDGIAYSGETERYLALLGRLNQTLARQSERVVEVVAGIPVYWKGCKE